MAGKTDYDEFLVFLDISDIARKAIGLDAFPKNLVIPTHTIARAGLYAAKLQQDIDKVKSLLAWHVDDDSATNEAATLERIKAVSAWLKESVTYRDAITIPTQTV